MSIVISTTRGRDVSRDNVVREREEAGDSRTGNFVVYSRP